MHDGVETRIEVSEAAMCPRRNGQLLFQLIRHLRPRNVLELGTSVGMSALYMASAAAENESGTVVTLEGADALAEIASESFERADLSNVEIVRGAFRDTLSAVLENRAAFDFAFIDGHHDEIATKQYWNAVASALSNGSVVVFDDIHWSAGMEQAWSEIRADRRLLPLLDIYGYGIGIRVDDDRRSDVRNIY